MRVRVKAGDGLGSRKANEGEIKKREKADRNIRMAGASA